MKALLGSVIYSVLLTRDVRLTQKQDFPGKTKRSQKVSDSIEKANFAQTDASAAQMPATTARDDLNMLKFVHLSFVYTGRSHDLGRLVTLLSRG